MKTNKKELIYNQCQRLDIRKRGKGRGSTFDLRLDWIRRGRGNTFAFWSLFNFKT